MAVKKKPVTEYQDLDSLVKSLNKKFGDNAITIGFPDRDKVNTPIERIPTGSFALDIALGGGLPLGRYIEISGAYSATKGQPLDAVLPTPTGDKKMGDLEVGDFVFGSNGKPTKVTGIFDRGTIDTYEVFFSDGSNVVVDTEHLWALDRVGRPRRVLQTKEMVGKKLHGYFIPTTEPLQYNLTCPNVDPYLLGLYLADGNSKKCVSREESQNTGKPHSSNSCVITKKEVIVVEYLLKDSEQTSYSKKEDGVYHFRFDANTKLYTYLNDTKLFGLKSAEKFIPYECFFADVDFRTELLRGLMDGDGSVVSRGGVKYSPSYSTTSTQLSYDVIRLVTSLGGTTSLAERKKGYLWRVKVSTPFNPFKLSMYKKDWRVTERSKRSVLKIVPNGKLPIRCIRVEAEDHLYIADTQYHIVTHNTSQSLHILKNAQKYGLTCAFIDVEGTTTPDYMEQLGVDINNVIYMQPDGAEEATQALVELMRSGTCHLAVIDSIAGLCPTAEKESDMDESSQLARLATLLGEFFRKYYASNNRLRREGKRTFTLIGLNQLRDTFNKYNPETTPGGRAKGFASSVNINLRRGDWISEGTGDNKEITGCVVKFKIEKNKTYKRMQTGEFDFYLTSDNIAGISEGYNDNIKEVIVASIEHGVIDRRGGWFYLNDEEKYQGLDRLVEALKQDTEKIENLKKQVMSLLESKVLG